MESKPRTKRTRRAEVGQCENASSSHAQPGGALEDDASELAALEQLPPDVLVEVLQLLGPVESAPLRLVSSCLRGAVDNVQWRWLKFSPRFQEDLELAAQLFEPEKPSAAGGQHARTIRLAPAAEVVVSVDQRWIESNMGRLDDLKRAVASLLSGCTRSSGGLSSVALRGFHVAYCVYPSGRRLQFVEACLDAICADAEDCSCSTLKTLELEVSESQHMDKGIVRRLAHFTRLESLMVDWLGSVEAPLAASLAGSHPALRKVRLQVSEGAALAAFGEHRALVELDVSSGVFARSEHCFEGFSVSPVARRLRSLTALFGEMIIGGFGIAELPLLGRLTSLETLQLAVHSNAVTEVGPDVYVQALANLKKLRALSLEIWPDEDSSASSTSLRGVARAIAALRAKSLVDLTLSLTGAGKRGEDADTALAELLRAAGPALVELDVSPGEAVLRVEASCALSACPRLRKLELDGERWVGTPLPVAVAALAACPSLESLSGLTIAFNGEREATKGLEGPLRRLAAACKLGAGSGCSFVLLPSDAISDADRDRVRRLAVECVKSIFPKASVELS